MGTLPLPYLFGNCRKTATWDFGWRSMWRNYPHGPVRLYMSTPSHRRPLSVNARTLGMLRPDHRQHPAPPDCAWSHWCSGRSETRRPRDDCYTKIGWNPGLALATVQCWPIWCIRGDSEQRWDHPSCWKRLHMSETNDRHINIQLNAWIGTEPDHYLL